MFCGICLILVALLILLMSFAFLFHIFRIHFYQEDFVVMTKILMLALPGIGIIGAIMLGNYGAELIIGSD